MGPKPSEERFPTDTYTVGSSDSCFMNIADIGSRLASERQARSLDRSVVAKQLAMSVKQVQEIEEGGSSAFYSEDHKMWAARKYAKFLELEAPGL